MRTPKFPNRQVRSRVPSQVTETGSVLRCWQGYAFAMNGPHRHDDLEVNLVSEAPLTYLFGGTAVEIRPGQIGLFWAAMPHRLIDCPTNWRAYVSWLHLPLDLVLQWGLPEDAVSRLLRGLPIISDTGAGPGAPAGRGLPEAGDFARWATDLANGSADLREIALLEIQAAIRRLVHDLGEGRPGRAPASRAPEASVPRARTDEPSWDEGADRSGARADVGEPVRHAAAMARHAATYFREPIGPSDVASVVPLHPNYAMTVFRTVVGMTLGEYLTQCRIAEAQRLLITTGATTAEIAAASGFGSQSAFYAAFTKTCGLAPGAYRRTYR